MPDTRLGLTCRMDGKLILYTRVHKPDQNVSNEDKPKHKSSLRTEGNQYDFPI